MKLALECPIQLLPTIQPLADFDFILTHLVLSDKHYADFYAGSERFKILDNSVNEVGTPTSIEDLQEVQKIVHADFIVPPDFSRDYASTSKALVRAEFTFGKEKLLPVIQGKDLQEALCYGHLLYQKGYKRVAVPYDITGTKDTPDVEKASNRISLIANLLLHVPFSIHLLGMTTLEELESYKTLPLVESIDTGYPIKCGLEDQRFGRDSLCPKNVPTLNSMEEFFTGEYPEYLSRMELVYHNLAYLRSLLTQGGL